MGFTRDKSVLFAIVLAILTVSTIIIITDHENSSADEEYGPYDETIHVAKIGDTGYKTLQAACNNAADGDVVVVTRNIELDTTLNITKAITLTTEKKATIKASDNFSVSSSNVFDNNMIRVRTTAADTTFTIGEDDPNKTLRLDGSGKCRVLLFTGPSRTFVLKSSGIITNGSSNMGGGLYVSNGGTFNMEGGSIEGNRIDPNYVYKFNPTIDYKETDMKYSADVFSSAGSVITISGGKISSIFQDANKTDTASVSVTTNGWVENVYIYGDYRYNKFSKYIDGGGKVEHLLLASFGDNGMVETISHTEVIQPMSKSEYKPGDHVAKIGEFGYESLSDAISAAKKGDTILILKDITIPDLIDIDEGIKIEIAPKYGEYDPSTHSSPSTPFTITYSENMLFKVSVSIDNGTMDLSSEWTKTGGTYTAKYAYGTQISDIVNNLPVPIKKGYKFDSWSYTDGTLGTVSANITANYTANEYDIHLHHGDDGDSHGKAKVSFDGTLASIISHAIKDGHRLIGYFTHETGGTMVLNADGTFASHNIDDHITDGKWSKDAHHTLYAQWEADIADTITKDINDVKELGYLPLAAIITAAEALLIIGIAMLIRRR